MNYQDDDNIDAGDEATMPDPFSLAIELCRIAAKPATYAAAVKKLRKLGRDIETAERKLSKVQADAAVIAAKAESDASVIAEQSRALDAREAAFASQAADVRDELREHHNHLEQVHRRLAHRLMATVGILGEWNWDLQSPPTWQQLRQMIADLPADLPAVLPTEVTQDTVAQDWTGHTFVPGSTLTRSINQ
jgi:hypothetical protein